MYQGAKEMAKWPRGHAAHAEDWSLVLSTHIVAPGCP